MNECSEHIQKDTKFSVQFILKPLETYIDSSFIPHENVEIPDDIELMQNLADSLVACPVTQINAAEIYMQLEKDTVLKDVNDSVYVINNENIWELCGSGVGFLGLRIQQTICETFDKYFHLWKIIWITRRILIHLKQRLVTR